MDQTDRSHPDPLLRGLRAEDLPRVSRIHADALPEDFCTHLGTDFLERSFYPYFLEQDGVGWVAIDEGHEVRGFVIGARGHRYYQEFFRRRPRAVASAALGSLAARPRLLGYYLEIARLMLTGGFHPGVRDAELLYIAVDPRAQGRSLGTRLTRALLASLSAQPYDRCVVKTLAATPENVHFYRRLGFELLEENRGRVWLQHPLPLEAER